MGQHQGTCRATIRVKHEQCRISLNQPRRSTHGFLQVSIQQHQLIEYRKIPIKLLKRGQLARTKEISLEQLSRQQHSQGQSTISMVNPQNTKPFLRKVLQQVLLCLQSMRSNCTRAVIKARMQLKRHCRHSHSRLQTYRIRLVKVWTLCLTCRLRRMLSVAHSNCRTRI